MDAKVQNNGFTFLDNIDYPLYTVRKAFDKTQAEISEITGIPQQTLSRIESYKHLTDRYKVYLVTVYSICCNVFRNIEVNATRYLRVKAGEK